MQSDDNKLLQNPDPHDIPAADSDDDIQLPAADPDQLSLDLQAPQLGLWQWVGGLRNKANRRELELELIPFWRNFSSSFAVITSIGVVIFLVAAGFLLFSRLPPRIPFYYNSVEARWEQADKIIVLFLPIGLGILDALCLRFIYDIFSYDRRLGVILSWILTMVNLLLIVASGQIYSLIL